jgi:hypothetical protein
MPNIASSAASTTSGRCPRPAIRALDANPLGAAYRRRVREWRAYANVDEEAAAVVIVRVGYNPRETVYFQGQLSAMRDWYSVAEITAKGVIPCR